MKVIECALIDLVDGLGNALGRIPISKVVKARVTLNQEHPGRGGDAGDICVTSAIKSIDFERRLIITQNNIYQFG